MNTGIDNIANWMYDNQPSTEIEKMDFKTCWNTAVSWVGVYKDYKNNRKEFIKKYSMDPTATYANYRNSLVKFVWDELSGTTKTKLYKALN